MVTHSASTNAKYTWLWCHFENASSFSQYVTRLGSLAFPMSGNKGEIFLASSLMYIAAMHSGGGVSYASNPDRFMRRHSPLG